jgi:NitT/TauT family transport system ATP-binding protein
MAIHVRGVSKRFGELQVFSDLGLSFSDHHISAVLGPSGCGKTTLLNVISGVLAPDSGGVDGVNGRRISYLFQEPRLLPWKTVVGNLEFVLNHLTEPRDRAALVNRFLATVGLHDFAHYYPGQLSGGMRQRVAIARAFAYPGEILLMDEPFQALDLGLKLSLVEAFQELWHTDRRTAIFVTHDIQEALILGDTIFVFSSRPARVLRQLENRVPRDARTLGNPEILALERELYELVLAG